LPRLAAIPRGDNALRFFAADGQGEEPSQKQRVDLWLPVIPVKVDLRMAAGDTGVQFSVAMSNLMLWRRCAD
jgi:hypothetical protein